MGSPKVNDSDLYGLPMNSFVQVPPATEFAAGYRTQWSVDSNYLYYCIAPNTWRRVPLVPTNVNSASFTSSSLVTIVTGQTETIANGMDLTLPVIAQISVTITVSLQESQNDPGHTKAMSVRLRRTNISGAILRTDTDGDHGDNTAGNQTTISYTFTDTSPTDGHYVVTVQETLGTTSTQIWSASRTFSIVGA